MNFKIELNRPEAPAGYPFAIVERGQVIAWVKTKAHAQFFAEACDRIESAGAQARRQRCYATARKSQS